MRSVFAYGTLLVPEIWSAVVGREFPSEPATLAGFHIRRVRDASFPGIVATGRPRDLVAGRVFRDVDAPSLARLDAYETDLYERIGVTVTTGSGVPRRADVYVIARDARSRLSDETWTLDGFLAGAVADYLRELSPAPGEP